MGRRAKKQPVPPWLTGRGYKWDTNKAMPPWVKLDQTLLQDEYFNQLSFSARILYLALMLHAGDKAAEWFWFTGNMAQKYGISRSTFHRCAKELTELGFVESRQGDIQSGWTSAKYAPTEFRATHTDWKNRKPLKINEKKKNNK